ncbi:MAG: hypothetical protein QQN63_06815 [Nitrosopumilus sp.]
MIAVAIAVTIAGTLLLAGPKYIDSQTREFVSGPLNDHPVLLEKVEYVISDLPPKLRVICSCESRGSANKEPWQFLPNGELIRGQVHPPDTGACQINTAAHGERLFDLGIDVETESGNVEFAIILFNEAGSTPWKPSESCWQPYI